MLKRVQGSLVDTALVQPSELILVGEHFLKEICVVVVDALLAEVFVEVARMHAMLCIWVIASASHVYFRVI